VFDVSVQAQGIRQAVGIAAAQYPGANVEVIFPIDPEAFFVVEEPSTRTCPSGREQPNSRVAA
jgi:hypothetical protein